MSLDNIDNIFVEYETFLQKVVEENGKYMYDCSLIEERGTNYDVFKTIIDTILVSFEYAVHFKENGFDILESKDIIIDNTFLDQPTIVIVWNSKPTSQGYIRMKNVIYNKSSDSIKNVVICYNEDKLNYPEYNVDKLTQTLWHELQHVYRQFKVLKQEEKNENFK